MNDLGFSVGNNLIWHSLYKKDSNGDFIIVDSQDLPAYFFTPRIKLTNETQDNIFITTDFDFPSESAYYKKIEVGQSANIQIIQTNKPLYISVVNNGTREIYKAVFLIKRDIDKTFLYNGIMYEERVSSKQTEIETGKVNTLILDKYLVLG